jgi:hypothetical protein
VFTSCSRQSAHDTHYFDQRVEMVSGSVTAPRLYLLNEELVASHFNAYYVSHFGIAGLGASMGDIIDVEDPGLPFKRETKADLAQARERASRIADGWNKVIADIRPALEARGWYRPDWIEARLAGLPGALEEACRRWRALFAQQKVQHLAADSILLNPVYKTASPEHKEAGRNQRLAINMRKLLMNEGGMDRLSEFYS